VFKGHINATRLTGGEKVVIPAGKLDTPENWRTCLTVSADRRTRTVTSSNARRSRRG
jgi:hypothetical protein